MSAGIWILGDRLSAQNAALEKFATSKDTPIILIESCEFARQRRYHAQKLVLVWSAMRHFARELTESGRTAVTYAIAEDFLAPLKKWIADNNIERLYVMRPSDRAFATWLDTLDLGCALEILAESLFLWSPAEFHDWAEGRKRLVLEDFYREGRKRFDVLMDGDEPAGGTWNFDKENRKPPKSGLNPPQPLQFEPDEITREVMARVQALDMQTYGRLEPFRWGVTRSQALQVLENFIETRLPTFGPYQDAMVTGEYTLWHALLSPYLNLGLLQPLEVVRAAEKAYGDRDLPLNSVEGFIRQVLGWREYMHGLYWWVEPDYKELNWFEHDRPLPEFFWDCQQTDMNCLHQSLKQVEATGYGHHIQRLMILGNFALISGVSPQAVEAWFHAAFIDAYDWVMATNVIGMGQFADGGLLATKPYAASANYIHKMSDYCKQCTYDRGDRTGEKACPFNTFYWDFLIRHKERLYELGRMNLVLANLKKMDSEEVAAIQARARAWWDGVLP